MLVDWLSPLLSWLGLGIESLLLLILVIILLLKD